MKKISLILKKYKINTAESINFGDHFCKIKPIFSKPRLTKKLVLVTATSPTSAGEGKTTISIGLNDALNKISKSSIVAIREPSMGPVFGAKGGANGGGKSQVIPKDEIDLHFTGDMHAITAANNLISACIDNEIYWGSPLNIDPKRILWRRVIDTNDRALRDIEVIIDPKKNISYRTGFDITVASELMAIFCLSKNLNEFKEKISNILVAYSLKNKPIYVKDLGIVNAILRILNIALFPNAAQSLEGNLALIHGGPFANIAHGCNSIIATNTALNLADFVVTEAGFASELGAEKFIDIVTNELNKFPNVIVLVTSLRSLKMHGGATNLQEENLNLLKLGFDNLQRHINNIKNFNIPFVVAINKFSTDSTKEINLIQKFLTDQKIPYSLCTNFVDGSKGTIDLAKKVLKLSNIKTKPKRIYELKDSIEIKIKKIITKCYGATNVEYSQQAKEKMKIISSKFNDYYICMAKTPMSFTDDPNVSVINSSFNIHIKDIVIANGAKFIIVLTGNIFRMPGLSKNPEAKKM